MNKQSFNFEDRQTRADLAKKDRHARASVKVENVYRLGDGNRNSIQTSLQFIKGKVGS